MAKYSRLTNNYSEQGSFLGIRALGETFYLLLKKDMGGSIWEKLWVFALANS